MVTEKKRRAIFFLCRELGINEDIRKQIQYSVSGNESLRDISEKDAGVIIQKLKNMLAASNNEKSLATKGNWINKLDHAENVYTLATQAQKKKIIAMSLALYGSFDAKKMDTYCYRQFKKPFRMLSSDDAKKLIEAQKSMLHRKLKPGA